MTSAQRTRPRVPTQQPDEARGAQLSRPRRISSADLSTDHAIKFVIRFTCDSVSFSNPMLRNCLKSRFSANVSNHGKFSNLPQSPHLPSTMLWTSLGSRVNQLFARSG